MTPFFWQFNTEHVCSAGSGVILCSQMGQKVSFDAPVTEPGEN
jgi:hypothetical protein